MTNAPVDLLAARSRIQALTGLPAVSVGIVGDAAHAATGGYHEGRTDLARAGVLNSDYSTRLARDLAGLTESASAMDIGYQWPHGGNAAWLRFNALLIADLRGNPVLAPIRATNYSPDGRTKRRIDRQNGWTVESSTDSVDVHTHIEWYRDTEGKRQACLDRLVALVTAAINNTTPEVPMSAHTDALIEGWNSGAEKLPDGTDNMIAVRWNRVDRRVADLGAAVGKLLAADPAAMAAALTPAQLAAVGTAAGVELARRLGNG